MHDFPRLQGISGPNFAFSSFQSHWFQGLKKKATNRFNSNLGLMPEGMAGDKDCKLRVTQFGPRDICAS
jgi:hypothetical protein